MEVGMPLESKAGNQLSCPVHLLYPELFFLVAVTSWTLYTCECVLADTLEFHQETDDSIPVRVGTWNCSVRIARGSGLISRQGKSLMVFLGLRREPGIYSRVMAGIVLQKLCMFSDIRTPVNLRGRAWDSPRGMEVQ